MKIFQINSVCGIGSTGRICTDLLDVLVEYGHDSLIAYGRECAPQKYLDRSIKIGSNFSVKLHGIKARLFDGVGLGSKGPTKRLIKRIKEYAPDIIHIHNLHGYYINLKVLFDYLSKADIPVVWTLHDCWAFTGHCAHFSIKGCKKWQSGCHHCSQKNKYPKSVLLDRSKRNYNLKKRLFTSVKNLTVVTPSEWLKGLVEQSFLAKYPVRVINNGIDLSVFKPSISDFREKYHLENKKIVLGVATSWNESKGINDFISLAGTLSDEYKMVLVGVTEEQQKSLPENILAISRTNSAAELAQIYTAADVFLNLTYEDNYPTVNLEAAACGTPVITYATGGSVESVKKENVANQGDLEKVAYLIDKVCGDKADINAQFDKNKKYLEYLNLYQEISGK